MLELLGRGGMGTVYLAEQLQPVRRKVALKLLSDSLPGATDVARFAVEQQSLARMSHPAIAHVYDAGTTAEGRPYFAMEYVPGEPITEFCNQHRLELRQRLELFVKVCRAVEHAHQKGVIHRDLKPGNILVHVVDEEPTPKVIDFGIATAARPKAAAATKRSLSGTPPYMSPEQAEGDEGDIDTRTDVYSLGAVLYELLTGTKTLDPERLMDTPLHELRTVLRDTIVDPVSTRVQRSHDIAEMLAPSPASRRRLLPRLRSEVDWIVRRALAPERTERYASAADLIRDLQAFLEGRRVDAVPQSLRYRTRALARQYRGPLVATAGVTLALLTGLAAATWGFVQARQDRDRAREAERVARIEAAKSERVAAFTREILAGVDPAVAGPLDTTLLRRILEGADEKIGSELSDQPEVAAAIHHTIGATYTAIGDYDAAVEHAASARDLFERELGADHLDTLRSRATLAHVYRRQGRYDEAETLLSAVLSRLRETVGDRHQETLSVINDLASLHFWQGRHGEAEPLYLEALEGCRSSLGDDHPETLDAASNLGLLYSEQDRLGEAEQIYLDVLARSQVVLGAHHPDTITTLNNLAALLEQMERVEEAEQIYLEALGLARQVFGTEHPETLNMMNNLAVLYSQQNRLEEALALHRQVREISSATLGPDHPDTLNSTNNLAFVLRKLDQTAEACELFGQAAGGARHSLPPDSVLRGVILSNHGWTLTDLDRFEEAEEELLEARDLLTRVLGPDHHLSTTSMERLETLYARWSP